jgi:hypothetical protein
MLEFGPTLESVFTREYELCVGESDSAGTDRAKSLERSGITCPILPQ